MISGHKVPVTQHTTSTCCRGCLSKCHGIEKGKVMNAKEIGFVVALIMVWIERQADNK
jgi:hypothetical protein